MRMGNAGACFGAAPTSSRTGTHGHTIAVQWRLIPPHICNSRFFLWEGEKGNYGREPELGLQAPQTSPTARRASAQQWPAQKERGSSWTAKGEITGSAKAANRTSPAGGSRTRTEPMMAGGQPKATTDGKKGEKKASPEEGSNPGKPARRGNPTRNQTTAAPAKAFAPGRNPLFVG